MQEARVSTSAYFLTITYDEVFMPFSDEGEQTLCKEDIQLFKKRLRKAQANVCGDRIRYYTVGEYGTNTSRPHYHSIMFNLNSSIVGELANIWQKGFVHAGKVTFASIHYVTKYVINRDGDYSGREPPFSLMSRKPGIGSNYLATHTQWHRADKRSYTQINGTPSRLPRFYKDKMFNKLERKLMALDGISESDQAYLEELQRLQKYHQDPAAYYDECIAHSHDVITSKANQFNKF